MRPRIGSMFSGYGGLDLGIAQVLNAVTVWVADVCGTPDTKNWPHKTPCKSPCTILAHRFPGVPNLGDVAAIDWSTVSAIEILCAGFPCQDVSTAGKRAGLKDGTRTGLWSEVVRAIVALQPRLVVLENVPGIFTAPAASDVEPCTWCVGDGPDEHLRALDAVLADLAEIGFDAEWVVVPASGVGAAHRRERWFLAAHPKGQPWSFEHGDGGAAADADGRLHLAGVARADQRAVSNGDAGGASAALLPSPRTSDTNGAGQHGDGGLDLRTAVTMLPTPAWTDKMKAAHGNGNGHGKSLNIEAQRLLQTPSVSDATGGHERRGGARGDELLLNGQAKELADRQQLLPTPVVTDAKGARNATSGRQDGSEHHSGVTLSDVTYADRWGDYADAIARWETVIGRPAPEPTQTSTKGNPQLSPRFTEWLMGLPEGWITDVPGITRNEALKACGNGVVPQQAAAALRTLLVREVAA